LQWWLFHSRSKSLVTLSLVWMRPC